MKTLAFFFVLAAVVCGGETITIKGREYLNATLTKGDEVFVKVLHESGIARVPFTDFPKEVQTKLGYDPVKAAALSRARLAAARAERESQAVAAVIAKSPIVKITVSSVVADGLIGSAMIFSTSGKFVSESDIFLRTDTEGAGYIDGARYQFDAFESGTFQFVTVLGTTRTVRKFVDARLPAVRQAVSK